MSAHPEVKSFGGGPHNGCIEKGCEALAEWMVDANPFCSDHGSIELARLLELVVYRALGTDGPALLSERVRLLYDWTSADSDDWAVAP